VAPALFAALDGDPSVTASGWIVAVCAAAGLLLALAITKLVAAKAPTNKRPGVTAYPGPPARQVIGPLEAVSRYLSQRLGRRGTLLTLFGLAYGTYGAGQFLAAPATRFGNLGPLTAALNSHAIGWVWIVGGLTGVIVGIQPRKTSDSLGFIAVFIPLMIWTIFYDISWTVGAATDNQYGNAQSWVTSIVWTVQAAVVLVTAGWPDPEMHSDGADRE
jgi:hypothetical protein